MPEREEKKAAPRDLTSGYAERLVLLGEDAKATNSKPKTSDDATPEPQTKNLDPTTNRTPHNLASPPTYLTSAAPPPDYARSTGPASNRPAATKPRATSESIGQPISRLSSLMPPLPPDEPKERSFRARMKRWTSWGDQETEEWRRSRRKTEERGSRAELNYFGVGLAQYGGPFTKKK